jgi:hypothetical protein
MLPKPKPALAPNTYAFESEPLAKPPGFCEYGARWLLGSEINLMGVEALGMGLGTLAFLPKACEERGTRNSIAKLWHLFVY